MAAVRIEPWAAGDLALLERLLGDPAMMEHLGGPETAQKIAERQERYAEAGSRQFAIVEPGGERVGWAGYWPREWRGETVWEIGWSVLPSAQGRGLATAAAALVIQRARDEGSFAAVHAWPAVDNGPSNAVCRKLGFTPLGPCDVEYPPGRPMRVLDWRLDLRAGG